MRAILMLFEVMLGLKVNFHKSMLWFFRENWGCLCIWLG